MYWRVPPRGVDSAVLSACSPRFCFSAASMCSLLCHCHLHLRIALAASVCLYSASIMENLYPAIEWFLGHCADHRKLSHHTLKAYRHDLSLFINILPGPAAESQISSVDRELVQRWLRNMNGAKPRTIRRRLATLKSMFSSLERHGHLDHNQLAGFRSEVKVGTSLPRTVARATVRSLLRLPRKLLANTPTSNHRKIRDTALIELLFSTGMRVSEVVAANIGHVDMDRLVISVRGKGNREREIPVVCDAFRESLEQHLAIRQAEQAEPDAPLFVNGRGTRMSDQSIRAMIRHYAAQIGVRRITPHMLRHTVATLLFEDGVDLRHIQRFSGIVRLPRPQSTCKSASGVNERHSPAGTRATK